MKMTLFFYIVLFSIQANAQIEKEPQGVIESVFQALSDRDEVTLRSLCTKDIIIVEDAKLWTIDTLANYIRKPLPEDYKRENQFKFLKHVVDDSIACITYENEARVSGKGKKFLIIWMETAVLIREENKWKLKILHSTTKERRQL
jgi:hypothetical protein